MSHLSQRQAAQTWNVSRASIQRAIKAGKLSQTTDKLIDPSEMLRVFGEPSQPKDRPEEPQEPQAPPSYEAIIAALEADKAGLEKVIEAQAANLADLRAQVLMLAHERTPPEAPPPEKTTKPGFWKRLIG